MQKRLTTTQLAAARRRARAIATQGHRTDLTTTSAPRSTKLEQVRAHYMASRYKEALAIAARFPQLGNEAQAIRLGHEAAVNPQFYIQLNKDPVLLQGAGIAALAKKYGWPMPEFLLFNNARQITGGLTSGYQGVDAIAANGSLITIKTR